MRGKFIWKCRGLKRSTCIFSTEYIISRPTTVFIYYCRSWCVAGWKLRYETVSLWCYDSWPGLSSVMEYQQNGEKDTPLRVSNRTPSAYRTGALPLYHKGSVSQKSRRNRRFSWLSRLRPGLHLGRELVICAGTSAETWPGTRAPDVSWKLSSTHTDTQAHVPAQIRRWHHDL